MELHESPDKTCKIKVDARQVKSSLTPSIAYQAGQKLLNNFFVRFIFLQIYQLIVIILYTFLLINRVLI